MDAEMIISLISATQSTDTIGQVVDAGTPTNVFARISSIDRTEWYNAGKNKMNPQMRATVKSFEYSGEREVEIDGIKYGVYRTYDVPGTDDTELYLEEKGGVTYVEESKG